MRWEFVYLEQKHFVGRPHMKFGDDIYVLSIHVLSLYGCWIEHVADVAVK